MALSLVRNQCTADSLEVAQSSSANSLKYTENVNWIFLQNCTLWSTCWFTWNSTTGMHFAVLDLQKQMCACFCTAACLGYPSIGWKNRWEISKWCAIQASELDHWTLVTNRTSLEKPYKRLPFPQYDPCSKVGGIWGFFSSAWVYVVFLYCVLCAVKFFNIWKVFKDCFNQFHLQVSFHSQAWIWTQLFWVYRYVHYIMLALWFCFLFLKKNNNDWNPVA